MTSLTVGFTSVVVDDTSNAISAFFDMPTDLNKAFTEALNTLEQQAKVLARLLKNRDENNPIWRHNITTVSANIADIYNEWLK